MDLLKNLKDLHLGNDDEHRSSNSGTAAPPPTAAPNKHENIFDKLSNAIGDKSSTPHSATVAHPQQPAQKESILDKFANGILGSEGRKSSPPPPTVAHPQKKEPTSFFDKLGDHVNQTISGHKTPEPVPAPAKEEHLFDKISSAISGKKEGPAPAQKPQTLSDKISDKLNGALGGGAKAEAKEDKLDKAIDLFQEHILKEGTQHNESAIEQAKDNQIADAIRKAVNRPKQSE